MFVVIPEFTTMISSCPKSFLICWIAPSISDWFVTFALYARAVTLFAAAISAAVCSAVALEL